MTKSEFYNLLKTKKILSNEEKSELEKMCIDYPYFSTPYIMLARSAKLEGSLSAEKKIQTASVYMGDRSLLFDELSEDALQKTIIKIEKEIESLPNVKVTEEVNKESIEKDLPVEVEAIEEELPQIKIEKVEEINDVEEAETLKVSEPQDQKESLTDKFDPLEVGYISEAVSRSIELEVSESTEVLDDESNDLSDLSDFAQWLAKRAIQLDYIDPESSIISINDENISPDLSVEGKESLIIDKFIETNPEITKGKLDEVQVGDLAATSIVDNEEFITETLAEIYAKQGLKDKARRAFELLSLKYPEKSSYFAGRFEALMASREE